MSFLLPFALLPAEEHDTLFLASGSINAFSLDPEDPQISVEAGASLKVELSIAAHAGGARALALVPTWGPPWSSISEPWDPVVEAGDWVKDLCADWVAPPEEGNHYLLVAMAPVIDGAHVVAGVTEGWFDWQSEQGICHLGASTIEAALENGWVPFAWSGPGSEGLGEMAMTAVKIVVEGNISNLTVVSATINGTSLDPRNPTLVVRGGEAVQGTVRLRVMNAYRDGGIVPLAATPTWGKARERFWEVLPAVPAGESEVDVLIDLEDLKVPDALGAHHIVFAMGEAWTSDRLMSGTAPPLEADWEAGNPIAGLPGKTPFFDEISRRGWMPFSWHSEEGSRESLLGLAVIGLAVHPANEIEIAGGDLNGTTVAPGNPEVSLDPSSPLEGSLELTIFNDMDPKAWVPVGVTPTWGDPMTSYWTLFEGSCGTNCYDNPPAGESRQLCPVSVVAPAEAGIYYLAIALSGAESVEQVLSGTHPAWKADWDCAHVVARLPAATFEEAMRQGWLPFDTWSPQGPKPGVLALNAVRLLVGLRGDFDGSGARDLSDAIALLEYLFLQGRPPIHSRGADFDGNKYVDIADAVRLLFRLFLGGPGPAP